MFFIFVNKLELIVTSIFVQYVVLLAFTQQLVYYCKALNESYSKVYGQGLKGSKSVLFLEENLRPHTNKLVTTVCNRTSCFK